MCIHAYIVDATVGFTQSMYSGLEDDSIEVCVEVTAFASGGSEVDVVVNLSSSDGVACKQTFISCKL